MRVLRSLLKCLLIQAKILSLSVIHSTGTFPTPRAHPGKTHLLKLHVKRALSFYLKRIKPLRMSIQPLILLTQILLVKLCWKWLPLCAISQWYSLASWNIQGHTKVHPFRSFVGGQHKFEGCHLEFGAVLPKTLLHEFYIKLENSWKYTMDKLSLVTGFILGEKTGDNFGLPKYSDMIPPQLRFH